MIYFVENPKTKLVKIGQSKHVLTRLIALRCEHGSDLVLKFVRDGGRAEEKRLHEMFSHLRVTGEWFYWSPDMENLKHEGLVPAKNSGNRNVTLDEDLLLEIEAWAKSPDQNRTLSNAIAYLCRKALDAIKAKAESK